MGLREDYRVWAVRDSVGDFLAAMCRQVMHDLHVRLSFGEQFQVNLIR